MLFAFYALNTTISKPDVEEIEDAWGKLNYYTTEDSTIFNINLYKGSVVVVGRESWNAGDQIVFSIRASCDAKCDLGILPAENLDTSPEYNSYGGFISEEHFINTEFKEITITVPETGEYGIGIRHYLTQDELDEYNTTGAISDIQLHLEVNKRFRNHL